MGIALVRPGIGDGVRGSGVGEADVGEAVETETDAAAAFEDFEDDEAVRVVRVVVVRVFVAGGIYSRGTESERREDGVDGWMVERKRRAWLVKRTVHALVHVTAIGLIAETRQ